MTKPIKTVTGSIKGIQETLLKGNEKLVDYDDVAAALAERNLLRLTKTIQISSNKKFLSIQFESKEVMETFCLKPLLVKGFSIGFRPEKKFPRKKRLLNISFINIPPGTPHEPVTDFLNEYADIVGFPLHISKEYNGIKYYTGTRCYQVEKLHNHIPRLNNMFGRTVIWIYDEQPTDSTNPHKNRNRNADRNTRNAMYNDENNRKTPNTQQNQEIISDKDYQQISDTQHKESQESTTEQETNHIQNTIQENTVPRKPKQTTSIPKLITDKHPPEKNNANYPELHKTNEEQQNRQKPQIVEEDTPSRKPPENEPSIIPET